MGYVYPCGRLFLFGRKVGPIQLPDGSWGIKVCHSPLIPQGEAKVSACDWGLFNHQEVSHRIATLCCRLTTLV